MSDRKLYLFESGNPDWVVAYDVEDARNLYCAHLGEDVDDYDVHEWKQLADDKAALYWLDPETGTLTDEYDGVLTTLTAREVVERFGRGFVASVDF